MVADIILGISLLKNDIAEIKKIPRKREIILVLRDFRNFPYFSCWVALLNDFSRSIPVFFLAYIFDNEAVGAFGPGRHTLKTANIPLLT